MGVTLKVSHWILFLSKITVIFIFKYMYVCLRFYYCLSLSCKKIIK